MYETEPWMLHADARGLLDEPVDTRLSELARTLTGRINRTTAEVTAP
jgi:hypothetical protein